MKLATHVVEGRQPGPHLLITAGVHGDEFESMAAIRRLAIELDAAALTGKVTLVPVVNEPAFRRGHRCGDDGLDLARTCPGKSDGTPTEQIAYALSELIRTADYYVDLHTGGTRLTVLPLSGYMLHPDRDVLAAQRRMARALGLPIIWGTDPSLNGRSLSVARDAGIPAIYAEYRRGGQCDPRGIEAYFQGCLNIMREFGLLAGPVPNSPAPLIVEDDRPGSGHMQINHPAPCEGFFQPLVTLGQYVRTGDPLGTITDTLGRSVETIVSRYTGVVIVQHTYPTVVVKDSIAVVMETGC